MFIANYRYIVILLLLENRKEMRSRSGAFHSDSEEGFIEVFHLLYS